MASGIVANAWTRRTAVASRSFAPSRSIHSTSRRCKAARTPAFVFDIVRAAISLSFSRGYAARARALTIMPSSADHAQDGVLKLGKKAIPRALEALALLDRAKIPRVLCTNGGGVPDAQRAKSLTRLLGVEITPSILCQSSTPFRRFVPQHGDKPILALGGRDDSARRVCEALGFKRVFTPHDLMRWRPAIYPWGTASPEHSIEHDFSDVSFAAAFVVRASRHLRS